MTVTASEHRLTTGLGTLYAKAWAPPEPRATDAAAILLFHDSLGSVELWRDFPERLARATGRRVVAYDRLGFGRSDAHPARLSPTFIDDEAATAVPRLREALRLGALVPFGHSVGGAMAIATAARWPEWCEAVITESAQAFVEDRTLAGIRAAQAGFARPGQVERLARYHGDKARWVLDAWTATWLAPEFAGWSLDHVLRGVRCPLLAVHGDRDEYGSLAHPERIARLAGGAGGAGGAGAASRMVVLDGCAHVPHREQPARVLDAVAAFLRH